MLAFALSTLLLAADAPAPATPASAAAEAVVAAAFAERPGTSLAPAESPSLPGAVLAPAAALAALALAAVFFARRRTKLSHLVQVLETASLGPKRSLIVAQHNGQRLLLGASEAGITLLLTSPAPVEAAEPTPQLQPSPRANPLSSILGKMKLRPVATPAFEQLLEDTAEDQALRAKLAAGMQGRVR
jgi:flagellar biogenesis protein FliO